MIYEVYAFWKNRISKILKGHHRPHDFVRWVTPSCLRSLLVFAAENCPREGRKKKRHAKNETHLWHSPASIDTSPFSRLEDVTIPFLIRKLIGRAAPLNTSCF